MNTDKTWNYFGTHDPYYGVLTNEEFRGGANRERFWRTGQTHIDRLLSLLQQLFNLPAPVRFRRALDFGCGVGRLTLPLSRACDEVVGVDVSPAILAKAQSDCQQMGVANARFLLTDDELSAVSGAFDLVHTFIVLQHIRPRRGYKIIESLLSRLAPNGIGALEMTYQRDATPHVELAYRLCTRMPLLTRLLNVLVLKRPAGQLLAEMNEYDLGRVMTILCDHGCQRVHLDFSASNARWYKTRGVYLFFQKSPVPVW